ncbi:hypothetical protein Taro_023315 [Colocasia esculenta]|uniref:Uracil-DNA glycosylase n=1 Tax=Colocasia esculenta TaxID=4460 RepID=A0A843V3H9_COLES|nr:hypothetical protein [Colocasia esculenta]
MASTATSSSKTLVGVVQPAKRLKTLASPDKLASMSSISALCNASASGLDISSPKPEPAPSTLTPEQKTRIVINKYFARSRRNLRICTERIAKCKGEGMHYVKLEELLAEETWAEALPGEFEKPYAKNLFRFLERELQGSTPIYPPQHLIFNALNSTPYDRVKAVIIGQDPYHGPGQAMGLAFSVPQGIKVPSSLVNIFKELKEDLGCSIPAHGNLERWAIQEFTQYELITLGLIENDVVKQGVLLINTVLTVRNHQANSHAKKGWEQFTDAVIQTISQKKSGVVFLLWGNSAQEKLRCAFVWQEYLVPCIAAFQGFGCTLDGAYDITKKRKTRNTIGRTTTETHYRKKNFKRRSVLTVATPVLILLHHLASSLRFLSLFNGSHTGRRLIDESKHHILRAAHPSGLSANRGFFGCRHFSKANEILERMGLTPIDWQL